jgi:hypothetical protein
MRRHLERCLDMAWTIPEDGPIKADDVKFMETEKEKLLDFGPIGGSEAGQVLSAA